MDFKTQKAFVMSQSCLTIKTCLAFIFFSLLGLSLSPNGIAQYFSTQPALFDISHYLAIAHSGYLEAPQYAFFPLWPMCLKLFSWHPYLTSNEVLIGSTLAVLLFFTSLFVFQRLIHDWVDEKTQTLLLVFFAFNPNSLFHALPYSESLSGLIGVLLLYFLYYSQEKRSQFFIFTLSFLFSFSRPILLQQIFSLLFAWTCLRFQPIYKKSTFNAILGSLLGYSLFGLIALSNGDGFFAPFQAQSHWDRKFGFYWELIVNPMSVSGSDNVLFWDLQAFYLPPVFLICSLFFKKKPSFLMIYCLAFAAAHSAIAFLSYPRFMSLSRHVFSLPFFMVGVTLFLKELSPKIQNRFKTWGWLYAIVSVAFFVYWWTRYAREGWIG